MYFKYLAYALPQEMRTLLSKMINHELIHDLFSFLKKMHLELTWKFLNYNLDGYTIPSDLRNA